MMNYWVRFCRYIQDNNTKATELYFSLKYKSLVYFYIFFSQFIESIIKIKRFTMVIKPYESMYIKSKIEIPTFNTDEIVFGIYHNDNRQWHV